MLFDTPEIGAPRAVVGDRSRPCGATAALFLFVIAVGVRALGRRPMLGDVESPRPDRRRARAAGTERAGRVAGRAVARGRSRASRWRHGDVGPRDRGGRADAEGREERGRRRLISLVVLIVVVVVVALFFFIGSFVRILSEYERGVIFRLGRTARAVFNPGGQGTGPGLVLLMPFIDRMVKVSLRTVTMDVPPQDVITRDNVSIKVNAVIYFRVVDPERASSRSRTISTRRRRSRRRRCAACSGRPSSTSCCPRATRSTSSCSRSSTSTPTPGASR